MQIYVAPVVFYPCKVVLEFIIFLLSAILAAKTEASHMWEGAKSVSRVANKKDNAKSCARGTKNE
jgi:hypothetical protein